MLGELDLLRDSNNTETGHGHAWYRCTSAVASTPSGEIARSSQAKGRHTFHPLIRSGLSNVEVPGAATTMSRFNRIALVLTVVVCTLMACGYYGQPPRSGIGFDLSKDLDPELVHCIFVIRPNRGRTELRQRALP
jgi:hypothetical protein